jgi:hypothetical protein
VVSIYPGIGDPLQQTRRPVILFQLWKVRNIAPFRTFCGTHVLFTERIMNNVFVIIGVIVVIIAILSFLGLR